MQDLQDRASTRASLSFATYRFANYIVGTLATIMSAAPALAQCGADPVPFGATVSPSDSFSVKEYAFAHSSTNLQGNPAYRKTAAGLFWNPAGAFGTGVPRAFGAFSSAIVVNNPDPNRGTTIRIKYHGSDGALLGTTGPISIPPDGSYTEDARTIGLGSTGVGSASVEVEDPMVDAPIVGATMHYFDSVAVPNWGIARDPDAITIPSTGQIEGGPGEGSYQQLQETPSMPKGELSTYDGWLFAGPYRFSNTSGNDFDNGSAPITMIANPHDHAVTVAIVLVAVGPNGFVADIATRVETIAAHGMLFDDWLWNGMHRLSANFTGSYHFEFLSAIIALDGSPLVGDSLVIDAFGDNQGTSQNRNLNLGRRMRMVSSALPTAPGETYNGELYASDVSTFTPTGGTSPMIRTVIHAANASLTPTGPITIEYFDHGGTLVGIDTVAGLAPIATLQIGHGEIQTPNFPANLWNGSVRIRGQCQRERLIGWTHREIGRAPSSWPSNYQYFKAYGEELTGANGTEPGIIGPMYAATYNGEEVFISRRVAPLVRTWATSTPPYWPGYTTFTNGFAVGNAGAHVYRFMEHSGFDATNYSAYQARPLTGLRFGATSLSYEDTDPAPMLPLSFLNASQGNGSARVDCTEIPNFVHGINVLGDPFPEFAIGLFARKNLGPSSNTRPRPIDPAIDATVGEGPGVPWNTTDAKSNEIDE